MSVLGAVFLLFWGALTLHLAVRGSSLSDDARWQLSHLKTAVGAFAAGVIVSILTGSALDKQKRRRDSSPQSQ